MNAWSLAVVALVAVVSVVNLVHTVRQVPPPARAAGTAPINLVVRHEERFGGVTGALRRHGVRGTLGYVADLPAAQLAGDAAAMEDYFLTQFALVPWVIEAGASNCTWAIANFRRAAATARVPEGFHIAEDFGHGVLLLERIKP